MQITSTTTPDIERLSSFYNRFIALVPYCLPVTPDEFAAGLVLPVQRRLRHPCFFMAEHKNQLLGFVHLGVHTTTTNGSSLTSGVLRFLGYLPTHRRAGQALLDAGQAYLRQQDIHRIIAFQGGYGYPFFNAGRDTLPDRYPHILGLLGSNGYAHSHRMLLMERRNLQPVQPQKPDTRGKISITPQSGRGQRPNLLVQLFFGGRQVGVCHSESLGHYQQAAAAQDTYYIGGLGVEPQFQFQGWGKYLLHRTHWEMAQRGYQHAIIGTEQDNYRALLLYLNDGYRVLFTDYGFQKPMEPV